MHRCFVPLLATTLLVAGTGTASTVIVTDFSGSGGTFQENVILQHSLERMPNGGALVRVGYFQDFDVIEPMMRVVLPSPDGPLVSSFLSAWFVPLGEGLAGMGSVPPPTVAPGFRDRAVNGAMQSGRVFGSIPGVIPTFAAPNSNFGGGVPAGSRLFLLIYDGPTPETATEMGVFSAENWLMTSSFSSSVGLNTVNVDSATEVFRGSIAGGALVLGGVIPEPASAALLLAAAGSLFMRRRRHG